MLKFTITTDDGEVLDTFVVETHGDEIEAARALRQQLELRNNVADTESELWSK